jgi:hypothetical protein
MKQKKRDEISVEAYKTLEFPLPSDFKWEKEE